MNTRFALLALLALLFSASPSALAQISLESSDSTAGTGVASAQLSGFTVSSGESLLVMVAMENNGSVSDIQFNSSSVTWDTILSVNEGPQQAEIYLVDGLSGTGDIDFTFSDNGTFAVSAMSLSGVAGISASSSFGEPDNGPWPITYGGANGGYVAAAFVDNTFVSASPLTIGGGNVDTYLEQIDGTGAESAGRALAHGDIPGASGLYTDTFTRGAGSSSSRNAGALLALYPTGLTAQNLTWEGGVSNVWDTFGTANWNDGSSSVAFQPVDTVTFDDTGGVPTTVDINSNVVPVSVTVNSSTNNYTFDGAGSIGGSTSLVKSGSSRLVLNTGHSYTGGTVINDNGVIDIGDPGSAGTGSITLNDTAQFHVGDVFNNTVTNDFVVNGTNVIENNSTGAALMNLIGNLSGAGDLSLNNNSGGGINGIDLSGDNSGFTGSITLGGGDAVFLRLRNSVDAAGTDVAWDTGASGRIYTRDQGASASITLGSLSGTGGFLGANAGGSASAIEYRIGSLNTTTAFSGVVEDNGGTTSISKIGSGTLTLDGTNTYTGDTSVEEGILSITTAALADAADVLLATGGILDLDFGSAIVDTIDELFFNGIAQPTGTWGAIGSGAANETNLISGDGLLLVSSFTASAGDFDMDGDVDVADLMLWQRGGSPNGAGAVDLAAWQAAFNGGSPVTAPVASVSAVPEPSSLLMAALAFAGLYRTRN